MKQTANRYETALKQVLLQMDAANLRTREALMNHPYLYEAFGEAMYQFIGRAALRSEVNAETLRKLKVTYGVDAEDVQSEILLRIVEKLHLVLARPVHAQIPYCVQICNRRVVDVCRKYSRAVKGVEDTESKKREKRLSVVSMHQDLNDAHQGKALTLEDSLTDNINAEDMADAYAHLQERLCAARAEILQDLHRLQNSDQAFVYLCMYENMRPRYIYEVVEMHINQKHLPHAAAAAVAEQICRRYGIAVSDLPPALQKPFHAGLVSCLRTRNKGVITNKISDIKYSMPDEVKAHLKARMKEEQAVSLKK